MGFSRLFMQMELNVDRGDHSGLLLFVRFIKFLSVTEAGYRAYNDRIRFYI